MDELVGGAMRSMQAGLTPLKQPAPAPTAGPEHCVIDRSVSSDLAAAAEAVKREVSKVGLMWGGELKPTNSEAAPMLREFSERVLCLFALYNGIRLAAGAGATLAQHLTERATAVLTASKAFLEGVVVAGDATQLHVLAGRVFEACDAAKTPPLDNRTAVGRALTALLRSCTDPLREARELIDGGKQAGAHDERPAAVDADFEADECSPQELDVAAHSVALITATASLLRLCCRALLHDRGGAALANGSEPYENMLFLSRPVEALVNDLVAALYPPQETEEIAELSAALHTSCECIVSEFPVSTALPDITEALRTAQLQLDEAHAALAAAL